MANAGMNFSNHGSGSQPVFVGDGTQNVHAGVGNQYNAQYNADNIRFYNTFEDQNKRFLEDLMPSDPQFDKDRIIRTNGHLFRDSYIWILENETFHQWLAGEESGLLWVRGDPGKGKTMLLCGIIEELQRREPGCKLVYFFCQATNNNLNTAHAVLRGILYLMIKDEPGMIKELREVYHGQRLFEDANGWDVLCRMFTSVMAQSDSQGTMIIIDALDECIKDQRGLAPAAPKSAHLSLELNERAVSAAVVTFIKHKVNQLTTTHEYDLETRHLVYSYLVEKASNTFLWAALACRQLADINLDNWNVESKLEEFPAGLDELYARMLDQVTSSKFNAGLLTQILAIALSVFRPVEILELKHLLGPQEPEEDYQFTEVEQFFKQSFLHWLEAMSLLRCIFERIRCIMNLSRTIQGIEIAPLQVYHSALIFSPTSSIIRKLYRSEEPKWLTTKPRVKNAWSPLLQTMGPYYDRSKWFPNDPFAIFSPDGNTIASIEDECIRFWDAMTGQFLRSITSHEGFQSLVTAFSPDGENIATASYKHVVKIWDVRTGQLLQELRGHLQAVCSVDYSKDGFQLLSASDDGSIKLWSPLTGKVLRTFLSHERRVVSAVFAVFSPDDQTIVSASYGSLKVWDVTTSQCLRTMEIDMPKSIVLMQDGITLVVAFQCHGDVEVWDISSGRCLRIFRDIFYEADSVEIWDATNDSFVRSIDGSGHPGSFAFSPNATFLAIAWGGKIGHLEIWSVNEGTCVGRINLPTAPTDWSWMRFSESGSLLSTSEGNFDLDWSAGPLKLTPRVEEPDDYYVSKDQWIMKGSTRLLWLPVDYRPHSHSVWGSTVALGLSSGALVILQLAYV
ncbi:vegetative incompatibility protein het-e-1 [Colletotrichum plurivorum]|uniref:Vegetative incompatibility protein het-e-1 n=1 Tax=Colletotrichum plurivorum TaxID=2175906 RepID=A0A8H6NKV9_9PEZI|nr:vegetative incompatibility protein het-e-1 [Colletotrichum plurivorum]